MESLLADRQTREKNLFISGIRKSEDIQPTIQSIIIKAANSHIQIAEIRKVRPITRPESNNCLAIVTLSDLNNISSIFRGLKNQRISQEFANVYVNNDFTLPQKERVKRLSAELRALNSR